MDILTLEWARGRDPAAQKDDSRPLQMIKNTPFPGPCSRAPAGKGLRNPALDEMRRHELTSLVWTKDGAIPLSRFREKERCQFRAGII